MCGDRLQAVFSPGKTRRRKLGPPVTSPAFRYTLKKQMPKDFSGICLYGSGYTGDVSDQALNQNDQNQNGENPLEVNLELRGEFEAAAFVCLGQILLKAPAPL